MSAIAEAILTSVTRHDVYDHFDGLWSESEMIVDYLLAFSPLSKLLPVPSSTIKTIRTKQSASLMQSSREFLVKIGAPTVSPVQIDTSLFTIREKEIFHLLAAKAPNIVTFDELSSADLDNFSLYGVSKGIQRLRDKLEQTGVSGSIIQTKRGEGYVLVNQ